MPKDQGGEPTPRSNTEEELNIRTHADGSALWSADAIALRVKSPVSGCAHIPSTLRGLLKKQKAMMNASKALLAGKVRAEARARTTHGGLDSITKTYANPDTDTRSTGRRLLFRRGTCSGKGCRNRSRKFDQRRYKLRSQRQPLHQLRQPYYQEARKPCYSNVS